VDIAALVPELDVTDLDVSLRFYLKVLGFSVLWSRPEECFAYLIRERAQLMLQAAAGPGRRFRNAGLETPFGRGVNFQIAVSDVNALYADVQRAGYALTLPLSALLAWWPAPSRPTSVGGDHLGTVIVILLLVPQEPVTISSACRSRPPRDRIHSSFKLIGVPGPRRGISPTMARGKEGATLPASPAPTASPVTPCGRMVCGKIPHNTVIP
jgi:hypothetical protein